jgi:hypothetical protein
MMNQKIVKGAALACGLAIAGGVALQAKPADARVFIGFGFGVPFYAPYPYYWGPPAYYVPPVVYAPQPQTAHVAPQQQYWYYCGSPQGYYPNVQSCASGWQQVPATPPAAR